MTLLTTYKVIFAIVLFANYVYKKYGRQPLDEGTGNVNSNFRFLTARLREDFQSFRPYVNTGNNIRLRAKARVVFLRLLWME